MPLSIARISIWELTSSDGSWIIGNYDKAVIVSSDGDFYSLVRYLYTNHKLEAVLSPDIKNCSHLLKYEAKGKIWFMNDLRNKLGLK